MQIPKGKITNFLVITNIVVAMILAIPGFWEIAVLQGGFFPVRMTDIEIISDGLWIPSFLTPITASFIHSGFMHLLFNMLMLLLMGRFVEGVLSNYMLFVYLVGIYAAAIAETIMSPNSSTPIVGASGGISAIIAVYLIYFPKNRPQPWKGIPAHIYRPIQLLLGWILLNLLLGFVGPSTGYNIAIYAHIGGFIAGLLLAKPLLNYKYKDS